jgi:hypothetical protein
MSEEQVRLLLQAMEEWSRARLLEGEGGRPLAEVLRALVKVRESMRPLA